MENLFLVIFALLLIVLAGVHFVIFQKIKKIENSISSLEKKYQETSKLMTENVCEVDEKIIALSNQIDGPVKSFKTNNWDSIREAFKRPIRKEENE